MGNYQSKPGILLQRDIAFLDFQSIRDALSSSELLADPTETVMILSDAGQMYELNLVGAFIWEMLDGSHSIEEIADSVSEAFDVPGDIANSDTIALVTELKQFDLVRDSI